jgi:hypothetical protein
MPKNRTELDRRAITLTGHLLLAGMWMERSFTRRLKPRAWAQPAPLPLPSERQTRSGGMPPSASGGWTAGSCASR